MKGLWGLAVAAALSGTLQAQSSAFVPDFKVSFGSPITFATHSELLGYGFLWGPSDGSFGAIPATGGSYTFYGTAGSSASCTGSPRTGGAFTFSGTLNQVSGSNGCLRLFGPGDGPAGYVFDRDYAGGGQVVRFSSAGSSGWLMPFHGEYHWQNLANPPSFLCSAGAGSGDVPCFYSSIGLAVSTDDGKTFRVVGQIAQPSQPLSVFEGGTGNLAVGYGSLIVADANGKHLANPPADPAQAYFYLFYSDSLPGLPGACRSSNCLAVARAGYADLVAAALSGDPHRVAQAFHKYDGASPDPWTQPATAFVSGSATPDISGTSGKFAPLWSDEVAYDVSVIYDSTFDVYLVSYQAGGPKIRASKDLLHWSEPLGVYSESGQALFYPNLIGETGDATIGAVAPRLYVSSFPTGKFPDYATAVFESIPMTLSPIPRHRSVRHP